MHELHIEGKFGGSQASAQAIATHNGPFTVQDFSDYCGIASDLFVAAQVKMSKLREVNLEVKTDDDWVMLSKDSRVEDPCRALPKVLQSAEKVRLIILYIYMQPNIVT